MVPTRSELESYIIQKSQQAGVDPRIMLAMADTESGFNPAAVSPAGAVGVMQITPGAAQDVGIPWAKVQTDPYANVDAGIKYYQKQAKRFGPVLGLAAYNAGPGAVSEYGGIPPYPETQDYTRKVTQKAANMQLPQIELQSPQAALGGQYPEQLPAIGAPAPAQPSVFQQALQLAQAVNQQPATQPAMPPKPLWKAVLEGALTGFGAGIGGYTIPQYQQAFQLGPYAPQAVNPKALSLDDILKAMQIQQMERQDRRDQEKFAYQQYMDQQKLTPAPARMLESMGLKPGTDEWNKAMNQYLFKPQTQITNIPAPPSGYSYKDPNNPQAGLEAIAGGPATRPDESERRYGRFYLSMAEANKVFEKPDAPGGIETKIAQDMPFANFLTSPDTQIYVTAARAWVDAMLRANTGAAMRADELPYYYRTFFPIPGDNQETINYKSKLREKMTQGMRTSAGRAAQEVDKLLQSKTENSGNMFPASGPPKITPTEYPDNLLPEDARKALEKYGR